MTIYDGSTPAPGLTDLRMASPLSPPVTNMPGNRSRESYDQVINQFAVGANPRYVNRDGKTWCNIFATDVMQAMGVALPHWVDSSGTPAKWLGSWDKMHSAGYKELHVTTLLAWLRDYGANYGWRKVEAAEAQVSANGGNPTIVIGSGHVAVVRPGTVTKYGPTIAQAGSSPPVNYAHVANGWGRLSHEYWTNDSTVGTPASGSSTDSTGSATSVSIPATSAGGSTSTGVYVVLAAAAAAAWWLLFRNRK